jgi:hypothetical protein
MARGRSDWSRRAHSRRIDWDGLKRDPLFILCVWPAFFSGLFGILVLGGNQSLGFHPWLGGILLGVAPILVVGAILRVICYR